MPRSRAYRRHKRRVKLARRYRILRAVGTIDVDVDTRCMEFHARCNCFDDPREHGRGRRTIDERTWKRIEDIAW